MKNLFKILLLLAVLLIPSICFSATPTLYFSDLTSGPATGLGDSLGSGAIVTVWGADLGTPTVTSGSPQSGYSITVGGVPAAYVYEWGNATQHAGHPSDLYTFHKMQVIMFSLGATTPSGAQVIAVTTPSGTTNTLPFTIRSGTIYHIKTTGNDSNAGTWGSPWLTMHTFTNSMQNGPAVSPGSICYVHNGITHSGTYGLEMYRTGGTSSLPYQMAAYPGASVWYQASDGRMGLGPGYNMGKTGIYLHVSKIKISGGSAAYSYIEHSRLISCEIIDSPTSPCRTEQSGLTAARGVGCNDINCVDGSEAGLNGNVILGNYIHDYCNGLDGDKQQHTMYLSNRQARLNPESVEIGWNYLDNNWGNGGIHVYDEGSCTNWPVVSIHDNVVRDQRGWGIGFSVGCSADARWGPMTTTANIFNNVVIRAGRGPGWPNPINNVCSWFGMGFGTSSLNGDSSKVQYTVNVLNNTIYGSGETITGTGRGDAKAGATLVQGNIQVNEIFGAINFKNNLIYDINNYPYLTANSPSPTTHTNDLWYSTTGGHAGPPSWDTTPVNSDPLFVNAAGGDLRIQTTSPAKDAGANLASTVPRDFLGVPRPQGSALDIGAFEFDNGSPSDTTLPVVTTFDLNSTSSSRTVPLNMACTDETALNASPYCKVETNNSSLCSWTASAPTSHTFGSSGLHTLYGFCRDAAGNVSNEASDTTTITFVAPTVSISTTKPQTIITDSLTITGTASDGISVSSCKWRVGSAPDDTHGTVCTGTTSWSCATSGYASGSNTAYVGCTNPNGVWGLDSMTVNYNQSQAAPMLLGPMLSIDGKALVLGQ